MPEHQKINIGNGMLVGPLQDEAIFRNKNIKFNYTLKKKYFFKNLFIKLYYAL
jgi:hypothetical protein